MRAFILVKVEGPLAVSLHADGTGATVKLQVCGTRLQTSLFSGKDYKFKSLDPGHNFVLFCGNPP